MLIINNINCLNGVFLSVQAVIQTKRTEVTALFCLPFRMTVYSPESFSFPLTYMHILVAWAFKILAIPSY
jgi:hypothetical protein